MKYILILIFCCLFLVSCETDNPVNQTDNYMNYGKITGEDYRMCACCGGWFITIESKIYRFYNLPDSCGINLQQETYPVFVELDWAVPEKPCMGDIITVKRMRKVK